MKNALRHAGQAVAGVLPAAILARLGVPALATVVFLIVLVLAVACWIINSDDRTGRVARMMLAKQGDARCLGTGAPTPSPPTPLPTSSFSVREEVPPPVRPHQARRLATRPSSSKTADSAALELSEVMGSLPLISNNLCRYRLCAHQVHRPLQPPYAEAIDPSGFKPTGAAVPLPRRGPAQTSGATAPDRSPRLPARRARQPQPLRGGRRHLPSWPGGNLGPLTWDLTANRVIGTKNMLARHLWSSSWRSWYS